MAETKTETDYENVDMFKLIPEMKSVCGNGWFDLHFNEHHCQSLQTALFCAVNNAKHPNDPFLRSFCDNGKLLDKKDAHWNINYHFQSMSRNNVEMLRLHKKFMGVRDKLAGQDE